ncbi:MAG: transporter ATPase [Frankiales bacterium]|nr:transporter ATPase [Frankiales bacterium]
MTGLAADVQTALVTAEILAAPGEIVAIVGPNGSGKTSLLRAILGLLKGTTTVELDGRDVSSLPAEDRQIGWLPQTPSLFAHLSARDNVVFALTARGTSRGEARPIAQEWLDRLGVGAETAMKPAQLSGGQVARVALARALAAEPQLVLLDEPLSALDSATRDDVRRLLRSTLSGGAAPVLLVTHDAVDVVALADRLVVLEAGRVVQVGTPAEVAAAPRSTWIAGLLGQNAWRGTTDATGLVIGDGHLAVADPLPPGLPALALCEPSAVTLHRTAPEGSARNALRGPVQEIRSLGGRARVAVGSAPPVIAEVTSGAADALQLAVGVEVWAAVKATEVRLVQL